MKPGDVCPLCGEVAAATWYEVRWFDGVEHRSEPVHLSCPASASDVIETGQRLWEP